MNKIKERFPEICYFIENPKEYELLYYAEDDIHNEYALNLEEAKRIINTIESLQKENQEMKENIKFCLHSIKQEMEMSKDERTRSEMASCYEILKR